jgi:hypothetical protein
MEASNFVERYRTITPALSRADGGARGASGRKYFRKLSGLLGAADANVAADLHERENVTAGE